MRQSDCGFNWIVWVGVTRLPQLIDVGQISVTYRDGFRAPVLCTIQEGVVRLKVICSNLLIHFCIPSLFKINEWIPSTGFNFEQFYCKFIYSFSDTDKTNAVQHLCYISWVHLMRRSLAPVKDEHWFKLCRSYGSFY